VSRKWLVPLALALAASAVLPARARADETAEATASSDPATAAAAYFALAQADDARGDYANAAPHYRAAVAKLPSFRYAAKAVTRAALLEAHAEGDWAPYRLLESVRHDPNVSNDPGAIDALAAKADAFPPGPTRGEARMLCAEAYINRFHRRADGEAALREVASDPSADGLLRQEAAGQLVGALLADGDLAGAQATANALGPAVEKRIMLRVRELVRRRKAHVASIVDLALFGLLLVVAVARAAARGALGDVGLALRKTLPLGVAFGAYVALAGGTLASSYESGNARPFLFLGAAVVPVALAARAWSAAGSTTPLARTGRALLSASAVVAAAFLMLEAVNGLYLESFKL
jgi:hypothetical protein